MANQEHLDILKQGVDAWNLWRKRFITVQPDLRSIEKPGASRCAPTTHTTRAPILLTANS